jgi:hypothetical protein
VTFDDDMAFLMFAGGRKIVSLKKLGLTWPPPAEFYFLGFKLKLTRHSELTDEQRESMTHVCRCAEYFPTGDNYLPPK